jgi:threonine synthase
MDYRAWFRCTSGDHGQWSLEDILYRCPTCGNLLEVAHDLEALSGRTPSEWRKLFDERYKRTTWPFGSGVWGKKEWIAPQIDDANIVSLDEGGTNLFWADRYGRGLGLDDLWVKLCGNSHTGSFKDLGMTVLVSVVKQMIVKGKPIQAVACASTGDTSASLAAYCAVAGIPAVVLLPKGGVSTAQLVQPLANGAQVLALDTDFDGCMAIVQQLALEPGIYLANSMNSLRLEGQKTIAIEIVQQFDWEVPDWIVIPGGNLGNVSALGAGFLMLLELGLISRLPRIAVAQAERANPLYASYRRGFDRLEPMSAGRTLANAIRIGNPVSYDRAVRTLRRFDGVVEQASETELAEAAARADRTGMFNDPHTGVALAALEKLVRNGTIQAGQRTIVISTANGLKFADVKVDYHERRLGDLGITSEVANQPIELPPSVDAVKRVVLGGGGAQAGAAKGQVTAFSGT